jgi:hypothetical protein
VEDNCDVMPKVDSPSRLCCHRTEPWVAERRMGLVADPEELLLARFFTFSVQFDF